MSKSEIHYEVFLRRTRKDIWRMLEAREDRAAAIKSAQSLTKQYPDAAVRVVKETLDPDTREYLALTVFEHNPSGFDDDKRADQRGELPCRSPADLSTLHAREVIARVLGSWLTRQNAIVLELLHRVDLIESLEATEGEYQHAVQKVAIAQASSAQASVQDFVKQINTLLQRTAEQMYDEARRGVFPEITPKSFAGIAREIASRPDRERLMRGAIARYLADATSWSEKLERILDLADAATSAEQECDWLTAIFDEYLAELASVEPARAALIHSPEDLGEELDALTDLFRGAKSGEARVSEIGARVAAYFSTRTFNHTRTIIGRRILAGLACPKRMKPHAIAEEVALSRSIADRLIASDPMILGLENISEAFVARSARLLDTESIEEFLLDSDTPPRALLSLISLEDNMVGDHNKRKLASYVRGQLVAHRTDAWFAKDGGSTLQRLAELAGVRRAIDESGFAATDKGELGDVCDTIALKIEGQEKVLERIQMRRLPPVDEAIALLRLVAKGALPAGALSERAVARAVRVLSRPEAAQALADPAPEAQRKAREATGLMASVSGKPSRAA